MAQVLYRKYRSRDLSQLVGQAHITEGLIKAIKGGQVSHAYLFTGPRGTGKTSVARILAHTLNSFEYDDPCSHIDIIEIDAASNRRIDEIRDLREKAQIAPTIGKYKVYIIDEVHMLTKEAFNALLKTLEEPPAHVIFILATTELHKVPETIISRTQRYSFRPIDKQNIVSHLATIASKEGISVDSEALDLIADHADGGFRDAISLLDQVRHSSDNITVQTVSDLIGIPPRQLIKSLWDSLVSSSPESVTKLRQLFELGYHAPRIAKELLGHAINDRRIDVAEKLLDVSSSHDPEMKLQLIVISCSNQAQADTVNIPKSVVVLPDEAQDIPPVSNIKQAGAPSHSTKDLNTKKDISSVQNTSAPIDKTTANSSKSVDEWNDVLEVIKEADKAVYGPLRLAEAEFVDDVLCLRLKFPFHIKRLAEPQNLQTIVKAYKKVTGKTTKVAVSKHEPSGPSELKELKQPKTVPKPEIEIINADYDSISMSDPLAIVRNVFGNAEVL